MNWRRMKKRGFKAAAEWKILGSLDVLFGAGDFEDEDNRR